MPPAACAASAPCHMPDPRLSPVPIPQPTESPSRPNSPPMPSQGHLRRRIPSRPRKQAIHPDRPLRQIKHSYQEMFWQTLAANGSRPRFALFFALSDAKPSESGLRQLQPVFEPPSGLAVEEASDLAGRENGGQIRLGNQGCTGDWRLSSTQFPAPRSVPWKGSPGEAQRAVNLAEPESSAAPGERAFKAVLSADPMRERGVTWGVGEKPFEGFASAGPVPTTPSPLTTTYQYLDSNYPITQPISTTPSLLTTTCSPQLPGITARSPAKPPRPAGGRRAAKCLFAPWETRRARIRTVRRCSQS